MCICFRMHIGDTLPTMHDQSGSVRMKCGKAHTPPQDERSNKIE